MKTLCVLLSLTLAVQAGAPPENGRELTAEERKELARLSQDFNRKVNAGEFEEAVKTAKQIVDYRAERQGDGHWEVIDERWSMKLWQRPAKDCDELVRGFKVAFEGGQLQENFRYREAEAKLRQALAIRQKVLGEQHPSTADSYNNVAFCLTAQGKHAETLPMYQKALAIFQKVLGEQHPSTADSYNNVAFCLNAQGKHAEALPLFQKALLTRQKVLGEQHPDTANSYNNVAGCLNAQGKYGEALPLFQKALLTRQKVLGEQHPSTATSYNNVALCLNAQGKHGEALPLLQKALLIRQKVLGEQHPSTAASYNNVAGCLNAQGKYGEALPLFQKGFTICQKVLGEQHPDTAASCNNVAGCLDDQGKHGEALPLYQKALLIRQKVLGEQHPSTAATYNNVALCLTAQGKHADALLLYQKALAISQKILGEQHPSTAICYNNVAWCLTAQGKDAEATRNFEAALLGHEFGRLKAADSGFDRSLFRAEELSPRSALVVCMVRLEKPLQAWEYAEADLARGLLDDLLRSSETASDANKLCRLSKLDGALIPLLIQEKLTMEETTQRYTLAKERDGLLAELARIASRRSRDRVLPLENIQKQIPADAAVVFWLDIGNKHLGCVLRREGPPVWVKLLGSGKDDAWNAHDGSLPSRALAALSEGGSMSAAQKKLLAQLHRQRITRLEPNLKGVRHLLVVPAGVMSAVPVEALTDRYLVSYIPSASVYARRMEKHRPLKASSLLVLADPVFTRTAPSLPDPPPHGLLILSTTPGSLATRIGLVSGDVLMEYDGKKLTAADDLKPAVGEERVPITLWREGKKMAGRVPGGNLGVVVDRKPIAEALAAWRKQESSLLTLGRGEEWQRLPGTRLEARTLAALIPATELLGRDASEQKLDELASSGKLKDFRLLHLATHGEANEVQPEATALILSQDRLPTPTEAAILVLAGKKPPEGKLTVDTILKHWDLDADLVVLSACQTGLGKKTSGDGMLGFTQALMQKGARSVVLSRWRVDDSATSLLMARFYQNLLGKRDGLKEPMKRAEALAEAKTWLRTLPRGEAEKRLAALVDGVPRGERGSIKAALPTRNPADPKSEDRPFAAPYYWAAFVLIGDPN